MRAEVNEESQTSQGGLERCSDCTSSRTGTDTASKPHTIRIPLSSLSCPAVEYFVKNFRDKKGQKKFISQGTTWESVQVPGCLSLSLSI